jgi:hypothetical protein
LTVIAIRNSSGAFVLGNAPDGELWDSTGDLAFAIDTAKQMLYTPPQFLLKALLQSCKAAFPNAFRPSMLTPARIKSFGKPGRTKFRGRD